MSESTRLKNEALERARQAAAQAKAVEQPTPQLQQSYQQAQQAEQPLEEPTPPPPLRTTSFAKTLDGAEPSATGDQNNDKQRVDGQAQGEGSGMVRSQQPKPRLVPDGPERKAVDAQAFNQAWVAEQGQALERAQQVAAQAKAAEAQMGQGQESQRGMGL